MAKEKSKVDDIKDSLFYLKREVYKLILFLGGTEILFDMEVKSRSAYNELAEEDLV